MDKNEINLLRFGIILLIIVGSSGFVLSLVYSITQPQILKNELAKEVDSLKIIVPELKQFEKRDDYYILFGDTNKKQLIGYVFKSEGKGYGGFVKCNVGINKNGLLSGIFVVSQKETPGLGTKIEDIRKGEQEPYYLAQYKNKSEDQMNFKNIQAISGATISSKAVLLCVQNAYAKFDKLKNEKN